MSRPTTLASRDPGVLLSEHAEQIREDAECEIDAVTEAFDLCDSPLERVYLLEYLRLYDAKPCYVPDRKGVFSHRMDYYSEKQHETRVFLTPQVAIEIDNKRYRADFVIAVRRFIESKWHDLAQIVVEIDGHDFHERTKQQARRDRSRDRTMTAAGFTVLRFTGSEIYENPLNALFELSDFISKACA